MKEFFSTYWLYIRIYFKAKKEYRTSFFMGILANFYCYFITYCTYWVFINGLSDLGGWDFSDLSILYGLSLLTYASAGTLIWYGVYHLEDMIRNGSLDILLTRPMGIFRQLVFQHFGDTFLGQIAVTVIFMTAAIRGSSRLTLTAGTICYLIFSILGGILLQMGAMIFFGSISFWTVKSAAASDVLYYGLRSMTNYPLILYPKLIQRLLTFLFPYAFINYYPALLLLHKTESRREVWLGYLAPAVGCLVFAGSLLVFRLGLRHYSGTGS